MRTKDSFKTAAQHAYDVISELILTSRLKPGERLARRQMAEITGVSTIAVTEALHRLETEGLVESRPHLGARVVNLDEQVMRDRYELREAIECQVVRILARTMSEQQAADMREMARRIDQCARDENMLEVFWETHYDFHLSLAELTGCQSLVDALRKIGFFILLQKGSLLWHMMRTGQAEEHESIIDEIMSRDPDRAERRMSNNIDGFLEALRKTGQFGHPRT